MFAAHAMNQANPNTPAFKSHYGRNQIWHAMSPGDHMSNAQVVKAIIEQIEKWWGWALADAIETRGVPIPVSLRPQGLFHVGKVLHTVQDSFSEAHVIRDEVTSEIITFQDYTKQDEGAHAEKDKDVASKALHDIPGATVSIVHSAEVLKLFKAKRGFVVLREYLLANVFKLKPGFEHLPSGGVRPGLEKRAR
jgi:hypothetical protein